MTAIKRYQISFEDESSVTLEVNTEVLTVALAHIINSFWGDAKERVVAQGMDVVLAVVRLFGARAVQGLTRAEASDFDVHNANASSYWTDRVIELQIEGWPGAEGLGIRIIAASLRPAYDYFDAELEEVQP